MFNVIPRAQAESSDAQDQTPTPCDLSPEGINKAHGKPTWRCWGCKAQTGLHWHNGWSVAMCCKPECAKAYDDMCRAQVQAQEALDAYAQDIYDPAK